VPIIQFPTNSNFVAWGFGHQVLMDWRSDPPILSGFPRNPHTTPLRLPGGFFMPRSNPPQQAGKNLTSWTQRILPWLAGTFCTSPPMMFPYWPAGICTSRSRRNPLQQISKYSAFLLSLVDCSRLYRLNIEESFFSSRYILYPPAKKDSSLAWRCQKPLQLMVFWFKNEPVTHWTSSGVAPSIWGMLQQFWGFLGSVPLIFYSKTEKCTR
jgi:hypothetical protein